MNQAPDTTRLSWSANRRSNALSQLLTAVALTPLLLLNGRTVVSTEATLLAVGGGLLAGAASSLVLDRGVLQRRDDVQTVIASGAAIIVGTAVIFLLVPRPHTSTLIQFTVAFVWGSTLTSATRHLVWPAITDSE